MKTTFLSSIDAKVRRHGDQRGLDTLVVHAVNAECSMSESNWVILIIEYYLKVYFSGVLANALNTPPGKYGRKVETQKN